MVNYKSVVCVVTINVLHTLWLYTCLLASEIYLREYIAIKEDVALKINFWKDIIVNVITVLGGYLSDTFLGKYKMTMIGLVLLTISTLVLSLTATKYTGIPTEVSYIAYIGAFLGDGIIIPTVPALAGDQFPFPRKYEDYYKLYFLLFYIGEVTVVFTLILIPWLQNNISCWIQKSCIVFIFYPAALFCFMAVIVLWYGRKYLVRPPIQSDILCKMYKCVKYAHECQSQIRDEESRKEHWLDYAEEKYGKLLVNDIRRLKAVLIFVPISVTFALFSTGGGGIWQIIAKKLTLNIGRLEIATVQMTVIPSLINIISIPLVYYIILPNLDKLNICTTPLQRIGVSMVFLVISLFVCGFVCLAVESEMPILPRPGNAHIRIYNTADCQMNIKIPLLEDIIVDSMEMYENTDVIVDLVLKAPYKFTCGTHTGEGIFIINEQAIVGYYVNESFGFVEFWDDPSKDAKYRPKLRTIIRSESDVIVTYEFYSGTKYIFRRDMYETAIVIPTGNCTVTIGDEQIFRTTFQLGGVYTTLVSEQPDKTFVIKMLQITKANSVHVLWTVPQYIIYSFGLIFFHNFTMKFIYIEAPTRLKCLVISSLNVAKLLGRLFVNLVDRVMNFQADSTRIFTYGIVVSASLAAFLISNICFEYADSSMDSDEYFDVESDT